MVRCDKCNKGIGYMFACTKVSVEDNSVKKKTNKTHLCLDCVQGKEIILGWSSSE
jgi:hypothetical protein